MTGVLMYGIAILGIGLIAWVVGRGVPNRVALICGQAAIVFGAVLIVIAVLLQVVPADTFCVGS